MPDNVNNPGPDETNNSANKMEQGKQSEHQRQYVSDSDSYRRSMTGYDSTKQDENFSGTEKAGGGNTIDERDTNDGDSNQENNY
ncbi:hypothetical protein [Rufibacter latericius]|uniref:Uncharacterized protein n=1 Tax=Rufibacter latericius TaxID=2487040 RepID=A0A3M9MJF5_9BACT|nr:hypothetical protein [Rufibacter latericius]RNI25700.1 hypothetical protein EFB08_12655 [Rufibacter latericius]